MSEALAAEVENVERKKVKSCKRALNDAGQSQLKGVPDMKALGNILSEPRNMLFPLPNMVR